MPSKVILQDATYGDITAINPLPVDGTVGANSSALKSTGAITRPANTNTYTIGDVVGTTVASNITFSNISSVAGIPVVIGTAILVIDLIVLPASMGTFTLHLFDSAPTAIADEAPWVLDAADVSKYLGRIDFFTPVDVGNVLIDERAIQKPIVLATASQVIYGQLVTNAALVGASGTIFTIILLPT